MDFQDGVTCPACEEGTLAYQLKDLEFEYKGKKTVLKNQKVFACSVCNESFSDLKDLKARDKILTDARRKIDGLLTSDRIRGIRNRFGMTQIEFAKALRAGEKNFARYESGQSTQGYSMDNVLRILEVHPQALSVIHQEWDEWKHWGGENVVEFNVFVQKMKRRKVAIKQENMACKKDDGDSEHAC